jgi:predicted NAD-dependent protein-ADP-ribosyltransferase YbiA (DUF1768 family)
MKVMHFPDLDKPSLYHSQILKAIRDSNPALYSALDNDQDIIVNRKGVAKLSKAITITTYGYAVTAHKSQGSQWEKVFVNQNYNAPTWNAARWYYTAITRAANQVVVLPTENNVKLTPFDMENKLSNIVSNAPENVVSSQPTREKINIYAGTGENAELSNFATRPFVYEEQRFISVEQAFQYAKGDFFNVFEIDPSSDETPNDLAGKVNAYQRAILNAKTGAEAKALGRKNIGVGFENLMWDEESSAIMKTLLTESFKQNPDALAKLLATGNAELTHTQDKGKWGKEFPKLLMEVRNELTTNQPSTQQNENWEEENNDCPIPF